MKAQIKAQIKPIPGGTRLGEGIYDQVFDAILSHKLPAGTKLSEESLANIFAVSRSVIRSTLQRLSYEGVVLIRPNKGATIVHTEVKEARQIFAARIALECIIVKILAQKISPEQIVALKKHHLKESDTYENGDRGAALRLSGVFHLLLAEYAENDVLYGFIRILISRTSLIIAEYAGLPANTHCGHTDLIEAIELGNEKKAEKLMLQHLEQVENKLKYNDENATIDLEKIFDRPTGG